MKIKENLSLIKSRIPESVVLVAVSKTKSNKLIMEAYNSGHRVFGENKVQEMVLKWETLPKDIEWHMIGHVQRNKVKYMAPFVSLIHGVDSLKLLIEINKQAKKNDRTINCLLQVHIAKEETKQGFNVIELDLVFKKLQSLENIQIKGLMGMATFTNDSSLIESEFKSLKSKFDVLKLNNKKFDVLSMGMSGDYKSAIIIGSTMIRVGSKIFGERN
ncbi:MAG: pyridoxal phosphate enzyme (YggS family) [Candidatus Marivariicella framensis]|jgi:pyridoxal phosphate enzyme (YggS family)|tara:strand:- start:1922 stop:2569 length:648 start_codon:yes stop_codon:yes gene_type:complete